MVAVDDRTIVRSRPAARNPDLEAVAEAIDNIRRILSPALMPPIDEIVDFTSAARAIEFAWEVVDGALNGCGKGVDHAVAATDLIDLTVRLRRADGALSRMEARRPANSLELVREALGRFDGAQSVSQLTQECPRAIAQLGFDRGMLSLVDKSLWTPVSAHSERQPEWAHQLVASGRESPQDLVPSLPEFDLVRRSRSILVTDVQQNPKVYKEVVSASQSSSYVAARVMSNGALMGFMHADKFFTRSDVDEVDRSVLGVFAEAFGYVLARAVVIRHISTIQSRLNALTAGIDDVAAGLGQFDMELVSGDTEKSDAPMVRSGSTPNFGASNSLTRREMEVLQLMANGASNDEIATRLFIANGTVKSHAKHILRKLGAANRAEAVSRWFSLNPPRERWSPGS